MRIAVLALQGAFAEHEQMLHRLGAETLQVRQLRDWPLPADGAQGCADGAAPGVDGVVIPGGESTTQAKLLRELGLWQPVREAIAAGLPTLGTCAGLIMLSPMHLGTMDIDVRRNAYGRQLGSFHTVGSVEGVGDDVPMTFIRAPYINKVYGRAQALATVDGHIVAARQERQLVTAFHPELDDDTRLHQLFLNLCAGR